MDKKRERLIEEHHNWVRRCKEGGKMFAEHPCVRCGEVQYFLIPDEPGRQHDSMRECVHCGYLFMGICTYDGEVIVIRPEEV